MLRQRKTIKAFQRAANSFYSEKEFIMPVYEYPQKDEEECESCIKHIVAELDNKKMITEELEEQYLDNYIIIKFKLIKNQIATQHIRHKALLRSWTLNVKAEISRLDNFMREIEDCCEKLNQHRYDTGFGQNKRLFKSCITYFRKRRMEKLIRKLYKIKKGAEIAREIAHDLSFTIEKTNMAESENLKEMFDYVEERKYGLMQYARKLREEIILRDMENENK